MDPFLVTLLTIIGIIAIAGILVWFVQQFQMPPIFRAAIIAAASIGLIVYLLHILGGLR